MVCRKRALKEYSKGMKTAESSENIWFAANVPSGSTVRALKRQNLLKT